MNSVIGPFVMITGVVLLSWNLYCLYHGMPMSPPAFVVGFLCTAIGSKWVQNRISKTV